MFSRTISFLCLATALLCDNALGLTLSGTESLADELARLRNLHNEGLHVISFPGLINPIPDDPTAPDYYYEDEYTDDGAGVDGVLDEQPLGENKLQVLSDDLDNTEGVSNLDDFLSRLGIPAERKTFYRPPEPSRISGGILSRTKPSQAVLDERETLVRYIENPQSAGCIPEPRTVEVPVGHEAGTTYFPKCMRLNRCGGCCSNGELRACLPTATEEVTVKVVKIVELGAANLRARRTRNRNSNRRVRPRRRRREEKLTVDYSYVNVTMEDHTQCECQCRTKEADCNLNVQTFDANQCACVCKNSDSRAKCQAKRKTHYWDADSCSCKCITTLDCNTHEEFNHQSCTCVGRRNGGGGFGGEVGLLEAPTA